MSHDTGNIDLRMRWPTMNTNGIVNMATNDKQDVDREHEAEGNHCDAALHQDHRCERHIHLDRADVGVGPRDELPGLDPVVERERHARDRCS